VTNEASKSTSRKPEPGELFRQTSAGQVDVRRPGIVGVDEQRSSACPQKLATAASASAGAMRSAL
jgi:hypothetical protein